MEDVSVLHFRLKEALHTFRPYTHPTPHQQPRPWAVAIKLLSKPSQVRTQFFRARSLLCSPLPGKAIKLFFTASPKTLPPRFSVVPVYRGQDSVTQGWIFRKGHGFSVHQESFFCEDFKISCHLPSLMRILFCSEIFYCCCCLLGTWSI